MQHSVKQECEAFFSQERWREQERASFFESLLAERELTGEERACAFWNVSDAYACLRWPEEELANHRLFERHLDGMDALYRPWIVSDGTQKMTLLLGGHEQYWIDLYRDICQTAPHVAENAVARFEVHRANVMTPCNRAYEFQPDASLEALENLRCSAQELDGSPARLFYWLTYYTQGIGAHFLIGSDFRQFLGPADSLFEELLPFLEVQTEHDPVIMGSWAYLNLVRTPDIQANVAINNYIVQLICAEEYRAALYYYEKAKTHMKKPNAYFLGRIELAKSMVEAGSPGPAL